MKEIPIDMERFTEQATAGFLDFTEAKLEFGAVREYLVAVARRILTGDALQAVERTLIGKTQKEIADELGWHKTKVTRLLHGASPGARSRHESAVGKLIEALRGDKVFAGLYAAVHANAEADATRVARDDLVLQWFRGAIHPPRPDLVIPLAVLLVASTIADDNRRVGIAEIRRHMPAAAIELSIPVLRIGGWIAFDGQMITVKKVPVEQVRAPQIDPLILTILQALVPSGEQEEEEA